MANWSTGAKRWIGAGLLGVAGFMLWGFMVSGPALASFRTIAALLITVGIPGATGGMLIRSSIRSGTLTARQEALRLETIEAEVLRMAGRHGGKLTIVEVASELGIPAEDAKEALDELMAREIADIEVTESGLLVYSFHDVRHLGEKEDARGLLDPGPDGGTDLESRRESE